MTPPESMGENCFSEFLPIYDSSGVGEVAGDYYVTNMRLLRVGNSYFILQNSYFP